MTHWYEILAALFAVGSGAILATLLTPLVAYLARAVGAVDRPNARTVHSKPIPRIGGIAIFAAVAGTVAIFDAWSGHRDTSKSVHWIMFCTALIFTCGLLDDLLNLPSKIKLIAILTAGTIVWSTGWRIDTLFIFEGLTIHLGGAFSWLVTVGFISAVTVAMNFIDGLDGLAAGIAAIALGTTAIIGAVQGQAAIVFVCLALVGSLCGFLLYNFNPAITFMGDCGSMFLGFALGCAGVIMTASNRSAISLCAFTLPLGIPLADLTFTMLRRGMLQRRSLFAAERGHIHHSLLDQGLSHKQVVLLLYAVTFGLSGLGLIAALAHHRLVWCTALVGLAALAYLFWHAGLLHVGDLARAARRNMSIALETQNYRRSFDGMQLRFANVTTFPIWWEELCKAADLLDLLSVSVPLTDRDGTQREMSWHRPPSKDSHANNQDPMTVVLPLRHRRIGPALEAKVRFIVHGSLEDASRRLQYFSRLVEEHSLASLPSGCITSNRPMNRSNGNGNGNGNGNNSVTSNGNNNGIDNNPILLPLHPHVAPQSPLAPKPAERPGQEIVPTERSNKGERPMLDSNVKIAVVHDFLYTYAGAERVLEQILALFPHADIFSLIDFLSPNDRRFIQGKKVKSSFIQYLPMARKRHRSYLPFMPLAIEQLDVSAYDLVISSSYIVAKGIITRPDQCHICYCHSPVRFAWDLQHQYLSERKMSSGLRSMIARAILHYIRNWDSRTANGVDAFVSNSNFVGRRIEKVYRRNASTIYPPVDTDAYGLHEHKEDFYLTVSRMVPYKKIDMIVEAFNRLENRRLIVIGDGPDAAKIKAIAGPNVRVMGYQPFDIVRFYMQSARAFVFAAEEDFGIVPVEAQACGTPVIAYGRGGVTESVISGQTGIFFNEQTPESIVDAVRRFENIQTWDPHAIRQNALRFSIPRFCNEFGRFVADQYKTFQNKRAAQGEDEAFPAGIADREIAVPSNGNGNGNGHGTDHGQQATYVA